MFQNYFKIGWRQLWKNKLFSGLNIFGLASSMAVCLLLIMVLADQLGYDTFHEQKDRIYRVISAKGEEGQRPAKANYATTALSLQEPLTETYSFIEAGTRMVEVSGTFWQNDKPLETERPGYAVDPAFLDIFSFGWIEGNQELALANPNTIVLTQSIADKFFPEDDHMGQIIELENIGTFQVTGVVPDPPIRSHIQFDFLMSYATITGMTAVELEELSIYNTDDIWRGLIYLLLEENKDKGALDQALQEQSEIYSLRDEQSEYLFTSQSLSSVVPSQNLYNEIGMGTPIIVLYFLIALGVVIIVSAGFNYMNLSIARSLKRTKEIGIRKVTGARKKDIVWQFLWEAVLISLLALLVAIGLLDLLIPAFYGLDPFVGEVFFLKKTPFLYVYFFLFSLFVGLFAGLFPALNIASFPPIQAIRQFSGVKLLSRIGIRKALVTFQFSLSLIFILLVVIVIRQQEYVVNADLGSNTDNLLNVRMEEVDFEVFAQKVRQLKDVEKIAASERAILTGENASTKAVFNNGTDSMNLQYNRVSPNYLEFQEIDLIAGKNFPTTPNSTGESFLIINETAVQRMGYDLPNEALGAVVQIDTLALTVIGVTSDFHHDNIWFSPIEPYGIWTGGDYARTAHVRLSGNEVGETLAQIRAIGKELSPRSSLFAFFTDERIYYLNKFFRMGSRIVGFVGTLTIIIACLGLLGMVIYSVEGRVKEVGIRKVLGASASSIVWQLSKGFFVLLGIASIIAIPITVVGANLWLENFFLRITISPSMLLTGLLGLLGIGLLTVVSQTYQAALRNPVDALRNE